jgi:hypothetical protein
MRQLMKCFDHQRPWRDHCVDRGLKDEWLEAMNSLTCWSVYSTCEGHHEAPMEGAGHSECARIWLKASHSMIDALLRDWVQIEAPLREWLSLHCSPDTVSDIRSDHNVFTKEAAVTLELECAYKRQASTMDDKTTKWFGNTVGRLTQFDVYTLQLVSGK